MGETDNAMIFRKYYIYGHGKGALSLEGLEYHVNSDLNIVFERVYNINQADIIFITGPLGPFAQHDLEKSLAQIPKGIEVVVFGTCSVNGGALSLNSGEVLPLWSKFKPTLFIPGSPASIQTFYKAYQEVCC